MSKVGTAEELCTEVRQFITNNCLGDDIANMVLPITRESDPPKWWSSIVLDKIMQRPAGADLRKRIRQYSTDVKIQRSLVRNAILSLREAKVLA